MWPYCPSSTPRADSLASAAFHAGDLVGVLDDRGAHLAVLETTQGSKARLRVGFEAKSQSLPFRQLLLLSSLPAGVDPPVRLGAFPWQLTPESVASARPDRRSWGAAWLLLQDAGQGLSLEEFVDLLCGGTEPVQVAACWLELVGPQLWFRLRQGEITARARADLQALRRDRHRQQLLERRELAWLALLKRRQPVQLACLSTEHQGRIQQLQQLAAGRLAPEDLDPGLRQSLVSLHCGADRGDVRHLLLELGQWQRHQLLTMVGSAWSSGFQSVHEQEAQRLRQAAAEVQPSDEERVDLTAQRCVTIDDDDTQDIDDGLALETRADGSQRIWIHVADPGRLIAADSILDQEARRRGSSLYLAQGNLPMFPLPLATGPFSLRQGQRSAAWSTWVDLDADGDIAAYGIERSWVQPTYRLSYADADDLIDLAPPQEADLAQLQALLLRRQRWRLRQGALQMDLPEGRIRSRDGRPVLEICEPSPSRQMVAEAMILAGAVAARYGIDNGLALPYRSQLPAELPPAAELENLPEGAVRFAAIKRCLSRGLMGTQPAAHFSLGLAAYVQATSPIRRYGDLLVQRQLAAHRQGDSPLSSGELQSLLDQFEGAVREGIAISREDQRHWQQVWFEAHHDGQWRAQFLRWLRPQDRLGLVRIDELAMDLAADCPPKVQPGSALLLRVHQVDSLRDQLRLVCSPS